MRALGFVFALLIVLVAVWPQDDIRWRVTVQLNTPQGVRTASGVWALKVADFRYHPRFSGEAIPLDLPDGRTVFALLVLRGANQEPGPEVAMMVPHALWRRYGYRHLSKDSPARRIDYLKAHYRNVAIKLDCEPQSHLEAGECPLLVSFPDPRKPGGVVALDPNKVGAALGPGYSLRGVFAQITDDPPSHQLGDRLPWLDGDWGRYLGLASPAPQNSLARKLNDGSFRRWPQTRF